MINVEVSNRQCTLRIDADALRHAVCEVLGDEGIEQAEISLAIVTDNDIHNLNRHYLQHDYPTDVLSFAFGRSDHQLEGEVIVSAETAISRCATYGWQASDELTLYVVHGVLHLLGYDDTSTEKKTVMQQREEYHLTRLGVSRDGFVSRQRAWVDGPTEDSGGGGAIR